MLLTGTAVFMLASAACAAAPDSAALIAARTVQGIGAAAPLPATLALIPHLFEDAAQRARAAVIWVAAGSLAVVAGPLVGGFLIDSFGWRSMVLGTADSSAQFTPAFVITGLATAADMACGVVALRTGRAPGAEERAA